MTEDTNMPAVVAQLPAYTIAPPQSRVNVKTVRNLAICQLFTGICCIILGVAAATTLDEYDWVRDSSGGIWGGLWIMITGIIGIFSSRKIESRCLNATYMAFSIVGTLMAFIAAFLAVVGILAYANCNYRYFCGVGLWDRSQSYYDPCEEERYVSRGVFIPLLILVIIEFFVSIVAASYCCRNSCYCCCDNDIQGVVLEQHHLPYQLVTSTEGQTMMAYPVASYPPSSYISTGASKGLPTASYMQAPFAGYPQQSGMAPYPGQMVSIAPGGQVVSFAPTSRMVSISAGGHMYVTSQGQPLPAQTNIVYSAQLPAYSAQPPTSGSSAPPPYEMEGTGDLPCVVSS